MNLYLISQDFNDNYDTYDSAVVCANSEEEARRIHPSGNTLGKTCTLIDKERLIWNEDLHEWGKFIEDGSWISSCGTWASIDHVTVKLIGTAIEIPPNSVVCSSYNAG